MDKIQYLNNKNKYRATAPLTYSVYRATFLFCFDFPKHVLLKHPQNTKLLYELDNDTKDVPVNQYERKLN